MYFSDGITINGEHSFFDYGLHISSRDIGLPTKNSIRKTIPFMNGSYDFTKINGGVSWTDRPLSYTFDIVGDTIEEMDRERTRVLNWLCNVHDADIYDDTIPEYHFRGSFDTASQSEDGEKTELTVTFNCYPFKIANAETVVEQYRGTEIVRINGQPVRPSVDATTSGYWYYRKNGAPIEENLRVDFYAGGGVSPYLIEAGEYIIGVAANNQLVAPWTEQTHTENGITFTVDTNGGVTASGTATATAFFGLRRSDGFLPPLGEYKIAGGMNSDIQVRVDIYRGDEAEILYDEGGGLAVNITSDVTFVNVIFRIATGAVLDNVQLTATMYGKTRISWTEEVL